MSFVEIGNVHVNAFSIDAIEMRRDDDTAYGNWWFVVKAGKHVYRSKSYDDEGLAIVAKDEFLAKCNAITAVAQPKYHDERYSNAVIAGASFVNKGFNINTDLISPMKQM